MSTILYDKQNEIVLGRFNPYYLVDGERPTLNGDIVELNYVPNSPPEINSNQILETEWQIQEGDYVQVYNVRDKTEAELLAEKLAATPKEITKRQMLLFLYSQMNVTNDQINTMINGIEDAKTRELLKIEWEFATVVDRTHPNVIAFAAMLGIKEDQLLDIFYNAKNI